MKLSFWGAARVVTGSCHRLTACGKNILIDCGLQQGGDVYNENELFFDATAIDAVCVTHAHTDHSGRLPLLVKNGYKGPIYATRATCDLLKIMLMDSARIQETDAQWKARKNKRSGDPAVEALYTVQDAADTLELLVPVSYGDRTELFPGVEADWYDAGHLLGSAVIRFTVTEEEETRTVIFSGDIGNVNKPIIRDPQPVPAADYVVMESTYGDRLHESGEDVPRDLSEIIDRTLARGGNIIIPSFAVGRTQELLYFLHKIRRDGLIRGHDDFPVYLDSPLAIEATHIYRENMLGNFDEEAMEMVHRGENPLTFPGLITTVTAEGSKAINFDERCKVILSASGMCEAGRIRHHLKHNLWRRENTILFVGYQAKNTLGRALFDGAKRVRLFGEDIQVNAHIKSLAGISGHADVDGLIRWLQYFSPKPRLVFVQHGEAQVCEQFAERLRTQLHYAAEAPYSGSSYDLLNGAWAHLHPPVLVPVRRGKQKPSPAMARLKAALQRLTDLVEQSQGRANKDLARLADRIQELCDKWEK